MTEGAVAEIIEHMAGTAEDPIYSMWVEDLRWHRDTPGIKFIWFEDDPFKLATSYTGGRTEYTTVGDLRDLRTNQADLSRSAIVIQRAIGGAINRVHAEVADDFSNAVGAAELQMSAVEYSYSRHQAHISSPEERTNAPVQRIHTEVYDRLVFRNPMILAWELKKMWDLYQAAEMLIEDTSADLANELLGSVYEDDIFRALNMPTVGGALQDWLRRHHAERGGPGDARRRPQNIPNPAQPVPPAIFKKPHLPAITREPRAATR